jgi:hypothetical protein
MTILIPCRYEVRPQLIVTGRPRRHIPLLLLLAVCQTTTALAPVTFLKAFRGRLAHHEVRLMSHTLS